MIRIRETSLFVFVVMEPVKCNGCYHRVCVCVCVCVCVKECQCVYMCTVNVINLHKGWKGGWVEWKCNYLCAECHFSAEICGVSLSQVQMKHLSRSHNGHRRTARFVQVQYNDLIHFCLHYRLQRIITKTLGAITGPYNLHTNTQTLRK